MADVYLAFSVLFVPPYSIMDGHIQLSHISNLHASFQAELVSKRELLAEFTCDDLSIDDLVARWRILDEVRGGEEEEIGDLVDVLGRWKSGGEADVQMEE